MLLCDYGCNLAAKFILAKKNCCESHHSKCPAVKDRLSISRTALMDVKINGQSLREKLTGINQTISKNKFNVIDENGFNAHQVAGFKAAETLGSEKRTNKAKKSYKTKKAIVDKDSGLSVWQLSTQKRVRTILVKDENGITLAQKSSQKAMNTMATTIDPNTGLSIKESAQIKRSNSIKTRLEQGIISTGYIWHTYLETSIKYQGSYEKIFLDSQLKKFGSLDNLEANVIRGPAIHYFDPISKKERLTLPDFIIGGKIYEVKSSFTLNGSYKNPILLRNLAKFDAIIEQGYALVIVVNHKEYQYPVQFDESFIKN
jgi:hypothetical protein